ncbi:Potassium transporter [Quillaja saponaria]|uniref:Potassium transporter n=1 Tax=Quillaja saponaria TaxID=32244 RepID=A0AAD7M256_QUISA|nr:Potassium transporter [Quillaja saponaria]
MEDIIVDDDSHDTQQVLRPDYQHDDHRSSGQNLHVRSDSFDIESRSFSTHIGSASKEAGWSVILLLAFQSFGIVYGDLGTSPLYVFAGVFPDGVKHDDDILGVLSLILYTLTLLPMVKYVFIVLRATDNGDGGTFALYSLLCRYAKIGLIPNQQAEDNDVSNFKLDLPNNRRIKRASRIMLGLENSRFAKMFLLLATMLGTSMVIGDGVLTPCISVLSAVGGIKEATSIMTEDRIVWISVAILVILFMVQRFGTDKIGYSFAPIICIWFAFIGGIGFYNFIKYDPAVVKAINPKYIVDYFRRNKKNAWISLGGVILCTTGSEALFADVGHFTVRSIQISMCCVTYPVIMLAYIGQASFLRKHTDLVGDIFYKSIPDSLYWPMFVLAILAATIASQAMISGTFSIIQQSVALGCFPRVKIVHTSSKYEGQVYIPEVNYLLMLACIAVTVGFKTTIKIGNAYGIAVVFVMTLTSSFLVLIMIIIWKTNLFWVISFIVTIGSVELLYLSSVLYKFDQGGYLPLAFAALLMTIMYVWSNVYRRKYYYELDHKIPAERLNDMAANSNFNRLPGLAMFYSELVQGIPPIFKHYMENVPAIHSVLVFVSIKSLPISRVPLEEQFLFRRVEPKELYVFRCIVRYGYIDVRNEKEDFEKIMIEKLKEFISSNYTENEGDIDVIDRASRVGVVHLMGENEILAGKTAGIGKKILIDYAYNFLKKNLTHCDKMLDIPHKRMLKIGMTYEL